MIVVAIIGILASVAVPAFVRYLQKAKTVEAIESLDKMKMGARIYFESDHWTGTTLDVKKIPDSIARQPSAIPNGVKDTSVIDMPDLQFTLTEPHYFAYWYVYNGGISRDSWYTALAEADLDGDFTYSLFRIHGRVNQDTGEVYTQGPIIDRELE